jgi:hypothetical protein
MDLLTLYTHGSELQALTTLSPVYNTNHYKLSLLSLLSLDVSW